MTRALARSMPARLALDLLDVGEPVAIAVLGMGVIENGGPDDDERIADAYRDLVEDPDPAETVLAFYTEEIDDHPWMADALTPVKAFAKADDTLQDKIRKVGRVLGDQSVRGCEELAEVDLLGRVSMNMAHLAARRKGLPGYNVTNYQSALSALASDPELVHAAGSLTDLWAGSGMRAIGLATAMRAVGRDPEEVLWRLCEADKMFRMIIAINARAFDLGEKIEIRDGSKYKQALLEAHANGMAPMLSGFVGLDALEAVPDMIRESLRDG